MICVWKYSCSLFRDLSPHHHMRLVGVVRSADRPLAERKAADFRFDELRRLGGKSVLWRSLPCVTWRLSAGINELFLRKSGMYRVLSYDLHPFISQLCKAITSVSSQLKSSSSCEHAWIETCMPSHTYQPGNQSAQSILVCMDVSVSGMQALALLAGRESLSAEM
ncbi:hypothetical protein XENOCAPTIV_018858 [Xenoophorus captivus]|uniref:Uncharacterized protein n=1 Tax=Xenoophorus captivus TaxID=1517983 RepID=A0ABV0QAN2_9TELE